MEVRMEKPGLVEARREPGGLPDPAGREGAGLEKAFQGGAFPQVFQEKPGLSSRAEAGGQGPGRGEARVQRRLEGPGLPPGRIDAEEGGQAGGNPAGQVDLDDGALFPRVDPADHPERRFLEDVGFAGSLGCGL